MNTFSATMKQAAHNPTKPGDCLGQTSCFVDSQVGVGDKRVEPPNFAFVAGARLKWVCLNSKAPLRRLVLHWFAFSSHPRQVGSLLRHTRSSFFRLSCKKDRVN